MSGLTPNPNAIEFLTDERGQAIARQHGLTQQMLEQATDEERQKVIGALQIAAEMADPQMERESIANAAGVRKQHEIIDAFVRKAA
ncbi:MAG: hypothetical protein G01um101425_258 [Candidatus Peregrinibacteria bacterium Gr01-1014_25]|nr:MAG: hypothetical protein G01um101425_258 [Candidatus Peregrinibacteria bacterium Gr01-1014_25]